MKLKEGRIGIQEGMFAAAVTLCMNGIFSINPEYAYSQGNSTYLSIPLSILLSAAFFLAITLLMKRTGTKALDELMTVTVGKIGAKVMAVPLILALLLCAVTPMIQFIELMHAMLFSNSSYVAIIAFIFPSIMIIAWQGMESIGRIAKCFGVFLLLMLIVAIATAIPTFETYRLYPIMGDGAAHFAGFTASQTLSFLPPLLALLIIGRSMQGVEHARRAGLYAALTAILVCGITQFALSLVYTYQGLADSFVPLYKINTLNLSESRFLRLDKLFAIAWLNGCMISSAFCIYAASLLFAKTFSQRDVNPSVAAISCVAIGATIVKLRSSAASETAVEAAIVRYGAMLAAAPLAVVAIIGLIKRKKEKPLSEKQTN